MVGCREKVRRRGERGDNPADSVNEKRPAFSRWARSLPSINRDTTKHRLARMRASARSVVFLGFLRQRPPIA